jgi:hypothetical protein
VADEGLTHVGSGRIEFLVYLGLIEVVCSWDRVDIDDLATDGCVPVMVGEGAQECLKNSASYEQLSVALCLSFGTEHILQRVLVALQPEGSTALNLFGRLFWLQNGSGFACIQHNVVCVGIGWSLSSNLSDSKFEGPQKPIIPAFEAEMRVTLIDLIKLVVNFLTSLRR